MVKRPVRVHGAVAVRQWFFGQVDAQAGAENGVVGGKDDEGAFGPVSVVVEGVAEDVILVGNRGRCGARGTVRGGYFGCQGSEFRGGYSWFHDVRCAALVAVKKKSVDISSIEEQKIHRFVRFIRFFRHCTAAVPSHSVTNAPLYGRLEGHRLKACLPVARRALRRIA